MKKFLVAALCLICILGLCACRNEGDQVSSSSKYVDLEVVENCGSTIIYVDRDTGVLYLWYADNIEYGQTLTPLYNADGTLKNIADFE